MWISEWSGDAVEVRIRPVARQPFRWGRRRLHTYFDLAHLAGDTWWRILTAAGPFSAGLDGQSSTTSEDSDVLPLAAA